MKATIASLALFAAAALAQANFTINTPTNVVACEPTLLSWTGGTAPYFLRQAFPSVTLHILPGGSPSGAALESLPQTNSTSVTWTCNFAPGSYIGFTLRDNTGLVAQTAAVTVTPGSSTSCVNITAAPGPTPSSGSSSVVSSAVVTPPFSSASGPSASSSAPSSTSTSTGKNAASANVAQLGVAGLAGLAVAALFL